VNTIQILFLLYINALEAGVEQGIPTSFAGDTSIFIAGNSVTVVKRKINETINKLRVKNGVFWDVTPCGSCKSRRFGET
jgi:ethanolamine utilization microcompartment shell protein EutL